MLMTTSSLAMTLRGSFASSLTFIVNFRLRTWAPSGNSLALKLPDPHLPAEVALDILTKIGMADCRPSDTPMDPNMKLLPSQGEPSKDPGRYRRLIGSLNYLTTITRPDITFAVSVVSHFMKEPCDSHWNVVIQIL